MPNCKFYLPLNSHLHVYLTFWDTLKMTEHDVIQIFKYIHNSSYSYLLSFEWQVSSHWFAHSFSDTKGEQGEHCELYFFFSYLSKSSKLLKNSYYVFSWFFVKSPILLQSTMYNNWGCISSISLLGQKNRHEWTQRQNSLNISSVSWELAVIHVYYLTRTKNFNWDSHFNLPQ